MSKSILYLPPSKKIFQIDSENIRYIFAIPKTRNFIPENGKFLYFSQKRNFNTNYWVCFNDSRKSINTARKSLNTARKILIIFDDEKRTKKVLILHEKEWMPHKKNTSWFFFIILYLTMNSTLKLHRFFVGFVRFRATLIIFQTRKRSWVIHLFPEILAIDFFYIKYKFLIQ